MNDAALKKFNDLLEKIKNLKSVRCGLTHERVLIDKNSKLPITRNIKEIIYDRIGLCRPEIRSERISCGHTTAHLPLLKALEILESEGIIKTDLRTELKRLLNRIYQLDHKKGDAEKHLAILIEKQFYEPEKVLETDFKAAAAAIREIESQHNEYVERLGKMRDRIIGEMQMLIEKH